MARKIQLIIGSTREGRIGDAIAEWVTQLAANNQNVDVEIVDLKEINLPFFNAALPPLYAPDETPHGKAWGAKVAEAEGYIFLTPEYNRSFPAALKNALDYLAAEWKEKPAAIISYGYGGGSFANQHLHDVLTHLKMHIIETSPKLTIAQDMFENGKFRDIAQAFSQYDAPIRTTLEELATAK